MQKVTLLLAAVCMFWNSPVSAQAPLEANPLAPPPILPLEIVPQVTPEAPQFSHSSSRRESAREAVIRRAAWKAAQRTQRIEAMKWYGYSPQRPPASTLPWMGSASTWIGGGIIYYHYPGVFYPRTASTGAATRQ